MLSSVSCLLPFHGKGELDMSGSVEGLSAQEIFTLVFIRSGLNTPYDFISQIGVGVGTSSPALKRMEERKLLTATPGPRNRSRYEITEKGEEELRKAIDAGPDLYWRYRDRGHFESLQRAVFLAWIYSGIDDAEMCIVHAVEVLHKLRQRKER